MSPPPGPPAGTRPIADPADPRRDIEGYAIAAEGVAYRYDRRQRKWIALSPQFGPGGHVKVAVRVGGKVRELGLARLVLRAFVGPQPMGCEPYHFPDTGLSNNALANLRWARAGTSKIGRLLSGRPPVPMRGESHPHAVLTEPDIPRIRRLYRSGAGHGEVAERFGVTAETVRLILTGRTWAHVPDDAPQAMRRKGPASEDCARAKIDWAAAREIRERHAAGESYLMLARAFVISKCTIRDVIKRRTWVEAEGRMSKG